MPEVAGGVAKCPQCGGEVQATAKLYLSLGREGWFVEEIGETEAHLYCTNDHEMADLLSGDQYIELEGDAVSGLAGAFADQRALNQIRDRLDLVGWSADVMDEVAAIVRGTGREVRDLPM